MPFVSKTWRSYVTSPTRKFRWRWRSRPGGSGPAAVASVAVAAGAIEGGHVEHPATVFVDLSGQNAGLLAPCAGQDLQNLGHAGRLVPSLHGQPPLELLLVLRRGPGSLEILAAGVAVLDLAPGGVRLQHEAVGWDARRHGEALFCTQAAAVDADTHPVEREQLVERLAAPVERVHHRPAETRPVLM